MSRYNNNERDPSVEQPEVEVLDGIAPGTQLQPTVDELPYISKSRLKTYVQCPAKFYWKYWCGERAPSNYYMEKGSRLHETFEVFHQNLIEYVEREGKRPDRFADLLPHWRNYTQWIDQFGAFIKFEERRWEETMFEQHGPTKVANSRSIRLKQWLPVEVEAEAWLGEPPQSWLDRNGEPDYVSGEPPVGDAPWMGRADLIADTRSVPGVEGHGVVIIDYKTGKVQDKKYRGDGIYLEGEYYGMLFEEFYDVDAVAGYYPAEDEFVVSPYPDERRQDKIELSITMMEEMPEVVNGNGPPENFPIKEQPLCNYGHGNCHFFNICPSKWGLN